ALALLIDYLDDRIRTASDTEKVAGALPALTAVPMVESWKKRKEAVLVSISDPTSSVVEAYWSLRASLNFLAQQQTLKTIVITSPAAGEGKTATVANLGVVAANGGQKAVIVSCDLRRPRLSNFFGQPLAQGLMNVVRGEIALEDAVVPAPGVPGLWILDSGPLPPDPHRVLNSPAAREMFEELALNFDWVLIDTPPLLPVADALVLAQMADATVIVATYGQTKKRQLRRALNSLDTAHVEPTGMILNEVTKDAGYGYGYGYAYGYKYSYSQSEKKKAAHKKERSGALSTGAAHTTNGNALTNGTNGANHEPVSPPASTETPTQRSFWLDK
ncbi:MAG TPA: CpsD/CapB family tyrosine-protein kinase, partial [Acidimicrobiales bacterium]|nr:CpsD/CapB family tyrosine-protein kinase [Acidimicrobiales bacterium]